LIKPDNNNRDIYESFALAMAIYFPVIGLLIAYLLVRIYVQLALADSDALTDARTREPDGPSGPFDAAQDFLKNKDLASAVAAGRQLPTAIMEPPADVISKLASLESRYENVWVVDYGARVATKNNLTSEMFALAMQSAVSKGWLAAQKGDGYLHVL